MFANNIPIGNKYNIYIYIYIIIYIEIYDTLINFSTMKIMTCVYIQLYIDS